MKRKCILLGLGFLLLIGVFLYFYPKSFQHVFDEKTRVDIIHTTFSVKNGEANTQSKAYHIEPDTSAQADLCTFLQQYTYRRTLASLIPKTELTGMSENLLHIYVYNADNMKLMHSITFSDTGEFLMNNHAYHMNGDIAKFFNTVLSFLAKHNDLLQKP